MDYPDLNLGTFGSLPDKVIPAKVVQTDPAQGPDYTALAGIGWPLQGSNSRGKVHCQVRMGLEVLEPYGFNPHAL